MTHFARRWLAPLGMFATGALWLACSSHTPPPVVVTPPIDSDTASAPRPDVAPAPPVAEKPAPQATPWTD